VVLPELVCKLVWGEPVETGVRPVQIVVDPPFLNAVAGMPAAGEQPFFEMGESGAWARLSNVPTLPISREEPMSMLYAGLDV
jgi:hypothetical protein